MNVTFEPPKRAPPKLGQNRKPIKKKTPTKVEKPEKPVEKTEDEPLPPKGAYNVDFDKFDDPSKLKILLSFERCLFICSDFYPFETKAKVTNNEPEEAPLPAKGAYNVDFDKFDDPSKSPK